MLELLLAPVDPDRAHELTDWAAWHGRLMAGAWGVVLPLGVLIARFFKVMPGQDWPRRVDNLAWWRSHLALQYLGGAMTLVGLALILSGPGDGGGRHGVMGWIVVAFGALQFSAGWLRGSKGGPTEPRMSGDHYDMTPRRKAFEYFHKFAGYALLLFAFATVLSGLWRANAPLWMWLGLGLWWLTLGAAFAALQRRGMAVDTYQAIWGPDPAHPGNAMRPIGWGVRRPRADGDQDERPENGTVDRKTT